MGGFNAREFQEMLQQAQKQAQDLQEKMQRTVVEESAWGWRGRSASWHPDNGTGRRKQLAQRA